MNVEDEIRNAHKLDENSIDATRIIADMRLLLERIEELKGDNQRLSQNLALISI